MSQIHPTAFSKVHLISSGEKTDCFFKIYGEDALCPTHDKLPITSQKDKRGGAGRGGGRGGEEEVTLLWV